MSKMYNDNFSYKDKLPKAKLQLLQNRVQIHKTTRSYMVKLFLGVGVTCGISTGKWRQPVIRESTC